MRRLFTLFFLIPALAFSKTGGPNDGYYILEDFESKWFIYDAESNRFVPVSSSENRYDPAHSVLLNTRLYKNFMLLALSQDKDGKLLVNNTIYKSLKKNEWLAIPVNELPAAASGEVLLTLYGSENMARKRLLVGSRVEHNQTPSSIDKNRLAIIKSRPQRPVENTFVMVFLLVLGFATILTGTNAKAFAEYFEISDLLTTKIRETRFLISKPLNRVNIAFLGLLSMLSGYIYILLAGEGLVLFSDQVPFGLDTVTGGYFLLFFLASVIAFFVYLVKFLVLNICGQLFGLGKTVNIHFYKNIQFLLVAFLMLALLLHMFTIQHMISKESFATWLSITLIIIYSGRTVLAFFSILKNHNIQYLFLIAYLCVVEVLPTIIGFRLAF